MGWPRIQAFEFNDLAAAPAALRESVVESLSLTLRWGRMLRGLVTPFETFLAESGAREVLDLCAGAGGPAAILAHEMRERGLSPPRFWLTDLFPQPERWAKERAAHPDAIDFVPEPVDATAIAPALGGGKARVIINALHHFPPPLVRSILADAVRAGQGFFMAEAFERELSGFVRMMPIGLPSALANPWLSERRRLQKAFLTYCTPVVLAAAIWDGFVSTLRIHTEPELRAIASELAPDWRWEYGRYPTTPFRFGTGYYFYGVPPSARAR